MLKDWNRYCDGKLDTKVGSGVHVCETQLPLPS